VEKTYVRSLFDSIARRYDFLNHLLSGGVDWYWRRKAVDHLREVHPKRILDVAAGTADLSIAAMRLKPERVTGIDIAEQMLEIGREKVRRRGLESVIELQSGDAEALPFEAGVFDAAMVAFGVRNFENLDRGLREMHRVLRPGGKIVVLEFSVPKVFPFRQFYLFYFRRILPVIGKSVSGHDEAYKYLSDSVMRFPEGTEFISVLNKTGFIRTTEDRLTFGIVTIYSGIRD
jgi:demethylmenaquinone methyltransferase/2-methoxy-6-polyprenyl-1,4-benzoquinol methylase